MADTSRDKRAVKLKIFNEAYESKYGEHVRGDSNRWEKELRAAGMRPDEIRTVFPRAWGKQRKQAAKAFRAAVKNALRTGREIPSWYKHFDFWFWD